MNQHWSEYWKQGYVTSFGSQLENNYIGKLKDIWQELSLQLPSDFNLLDICTGNASLPLLIQESLSATGLAGTITAIDLAQVMLDEKRHTNKNVNINLLSDINCQKLPFSSSSFDFCISQFGIEYSEISTSLSELARVLKTDGEAWLVLHHSDSRILQTNQIIYKFLNHSSVDTLLKKMTQLAHAMGQVKTPDDVVRIKSDKQCEKLRGEINQEIKKLIHYDEATARESELMMYVGQYFSEGIYWPVEKKSSFINFIYSEIAAAKNRLLELINAAVSQDEMSVIITQGKTLGLSLLGVSTIIEDQKVIAWKLHFQKN